MPGGRYKITVTGAGFSISARGQGVATLDGTADLTGATGMYAVGDTDLGAAARTIRSRSSTVHHSS